MLTRQETGMPVFVEHVVVAIPRDVVLEDSEAVAVDGPDEHRAEAVAEGNSHPLRDPTGDAFFQLGRGTLGERERDDRGGFRPFSDERGDPPGDRLSFSRTCTRDHLKVGTSMVDDLLLRGRKSQFRHRCAMNCLRER
jgi:hypothetical protein